MMLLHHLVHQLLETVHMVILNHTVGQGRKQLPGAIDLCFFQSGAGSGYKTYFPQHWKDEKYKWETIKYFQDHWNTEAEDFGEMFKSATDRTYNLLASGYAYPRQKIINFAKADMETTRQMFRDLADRVAAFQVSSEEMCVNLDTKCGCVTAGVSVVL